VIVRRLSYIVRIGVVLLGECSDACVRFYILDEQHQSLLAVYGRFSSLREGTHKSNNDRLTLNTQQLHSNRCCLLALLGKILAPKSVNRPHETLTEESNLFPLLISTKNDVAWYRSN
jgi:hypothetical protein